MSVSQLKPEEQVVIAASENLSMGPSPLGESQFSFVAANNCSVALQRGFYFSFGCPTGLRTLSTRPRRYYPMVLTAQGEVSKAATTRRYRNSMEIIVLNVMAKSFRRAVMQDSLKTFPEKCKFPIKRNQSEHCDHPRLRTT